MKKIMCLALALALCLGAVPAAAASPQLDISTIGSDFLSTDLAHGQEVAPGSVIIITLGEWQPHTRPISVFEKTGAVWIPVLRSYIYDISNSALLMDDERNARPHQISEALLKKSGVRLSTTTYSNQGGGYIRSVEFGTVAAPSGLTAGEPRLSTNPDIIAAAEPINIPPYYRDSTGKVATKTVIDTLPCIKVKVVNDFVSTEPQDVRLKVALKEGATVLSELELAFTVTPQIEPVNVWTAETYTAEGLVLEAEENIKNMELDMGHGVLAELDLWKGKRYYAKAVRVISERDAALMEAYGFIDLIYIKATSDDGVFPHSRATFRVTEYERDDYHVYGADGKYLGSTKDALPYSGKYFISEQIVAGGSYSNLNK